MKLIPDKMLMQPKGRLYGVRYVVWISGAVLVFVVIAAFVIAFSGGKGNGGVLTPTETLPEQTSVSSTTTTVLSPAEKQKATTQMLQQVPTSGTTTQTAPVAPSAEKQKLLDAMQQKVK